MHESLVKVKENGLFLSDNDAQLSISEKSAQSESSVEGILCSFLLLLFIIQAL